MTLNTGRDTADMVAADLSVLRSENEALRRANCDLHVQFDEAARKFDEVARDAVNSKAQRDDARARVEQLTRERDKLRAQVDPLRAEISKTHKALNAKTEDARLLEESVLAANRKAAAAEQKFAAFEETAKRMQRARDAAVLAYETALRDLDAAKTELAAVWNKSADLAKSKLALVELLTRIRTVMPADLSQVKNESFRKVLIEVEALGIRPKAPAKAG